MFFRALFAPSCISHTVLTKRDWYKVKIGDVSLPQSLHCWASMPQKILRRRQILPYETKDTKTYTVNKKERKGRRAHPHRRRNKENKTIITENDDKNNNSSKKRRRNRRRHSRKRNEERRRQNNNKNETYNAIENNESFYNRSSFMLLNVHSNRDRSSLLDEQISNNLQDHINITDKQMMADSPHGGFQVSAEPRVTYLVESNLILASPSAPVNTKPDRDERTNGKKKRKRRKKNKHGKRRKDKRKHKERRRKKNKNRRNRRKNKGKFQILDNYVPNFSYVFSSTNSNGTIQITFKEYLFFKIIISLSDKNELLDEEEIRIVRSLSIKKQIDAHGQIEDVNITTIPLTLLHQLNSTEETPNKNIQVVHEEDNAKMSGDQILEEEVEEMFATCQLKLTDRCAWPHCNHACPKLLNPHTGNIYSFIKKSFAKIHIFDI